MTVLRLRLRFCFNHKQHTEANGEENRDGITNNYSNNRGKKLSQAVPLTG